MIVTHRPRVPFSWLVWMTLPWAVVVLLANVNDQAVTYTIRKFITDPRAISLLLSVNFISNVLVGAPVAFASDHCWTRWGRRRPWLIASLLGTAVLLPLVPGVPSVVMLVPLILIMQAAIDLATPLESLYFEVIPSPQRGRAVAVRTIVMTLTGIVFSTLLFANFDARYRLLLGRHLVLAFTGETVLYCAAALLCVITAIFVITRTRETPVRPPIPPAPAIPRINPAAALRRFITDVFGDRRWYPVYLLYIVPILLQAGAGPFVPMLMIERFGFSKQQMVMATMPATMLSVALFMPLMGWLADRVPRTVLIWCGIATQLVVATVYWWYVSFGAPNGVPAWHTIMALSSVGAVCGAAVFVPFGALLFDCVPSNRMGTLSAGFGLLANALRVILVNACGQFVAFYPRVRPSAAAAGPAPHDYAAVLLFQMLLAAAALIVFLVFLLLRRRGYVTNYAALELSSAHASAGGEPVVLPE